MKRMRRKAGSILLTAAMFLSLFPAGALDAEPQEAPPQTCTCTVLCTEEAADTLCPVCAEDITRCTGKAAEPQEPEQPQQPEVPECTCTVLCTEETMDAQCPACAAGIANCTGKAAEPQEPEQPQQPEVPECTCTVLCTEDAVDTLCPACAEDFAGCTGEPVSHPPITLAPNAADVIYVSDGGTGDGSSEASCADFETAMQNAQEGDTFIVVGSVDLTSGTWKTPACSITVAGADTSASLKLFGKQIRSSSSPITSAVPAISLQGDIIFDDIILECTMSNSYYSFIYAVVANGNHLTLEDGVSVKWSSSGTQRQIHFYGGGFQEDVAGDTHLTIKTSKLSRHHIYGGGYNGDVQGDTLVEFAGTAGSYIGCSSVYGGGYAVGSSETANVSGTSRLQFEYYTPNASMFAGGYADGGTANVGSTQSDLLESEADGSALVRFYGGGYACNGGTANVEGNVSTRIEDRAVYSYVLDKNSRFLYNGGYADATSYAEVLGNAVMEVARQQSFQCSGGGRGPNTTIHGDTSISVQDSKNFWSFGCGDSAGADSVLGDITLTYQNTYGAIFTLGYTQKDTDKDTVGLPGSGSKATINLNGYTSGSNLHIHNGAHGYSLQRYWYDHSVPTTIQVRNHNNVKHSSGGAINLTPQDQIQIMSGGTLEGQPPFYGNSFPVFSYTDERKTGSVTIDEGGTLALKEDEHIAGSLTVNGTLSVQDSKKLSVDGGVSTGTSAAFATNNYVADRVFLQANSTQTASFASGNSAFDVAQRAGTGGFGQEWYLKQAQVKHIITASAGPNGTITPEGAVEVPEGANQTFHITPKPGYHIQDVLVDGASVGAVSEYTFPPVQANHTIHATFAYDMPVVGFQARMNPHTGSQTETVYTDGQTLEVDLRDMSSAYIKPYIDVEIPSRTPWEEHVYYTYKIHNIMDGSIDDNNDLYGGKKDVFGTEKIYNRTNTVSKDWIVADELNDERLGTSCYQIVVQAYLSNSFGAENPGTDTLLGTAQANLHIRMTQSKFVLASLDSYFWDDDFIDNDLNQFYETPESLISQSLEQFDSTYGTDAQENNYLWDIPVTWALKDGTTWSVQPGAKNVLTWTAHPDQAADAALWEIPADLPLSQDVEFQNPFAVVFRDGETILQTEYRKNGSALLQADFPSVPSKAGYTSRWSIETDLTVTENLEITAIHTPVDYTITYHLDGGTNHPGNPSTYTIEDTFSLYAPARDGYTFLGWTQEGVTSTPQKQVTISAGTTGALTFTAHWQKDNSGGNPDPGGGDATAQEFELHYRTNGGKYLSVESESHVWTKDYEDLPIPVRDGYNFEGWYWDSFLTHPVRGDVKVDTSVVVLYAKWEAEGTVSGSGDVSGWLDTDNHKAYLRGYPTHAFCPDRAMTRVEVAQMFYALLRDQDVEITASFTDVPAEAQFAKAVNTLASLGMMSGYPDGTFRSAAPITRAEFAAMALAFAEQGGSASSSYRDVSRNDWFYPYVSQASAYGWIGGYPDNTFRPNSPITRAEVCVIVNNMLGRDADEHFIDQHNGELVSFGDLPTDHWAYYDVMEATNSHKFSMGNSKESWTRLMTGA